MRLTHSGWWQQVLPGLTARVAAIAAVVAAGCIVSACGGGHADAPVATPAPTPVSPASSGVPVMSISASAFLSPFPVSAADYAQRAQAAFQLSRDAGARGWMSTWTWKDLEPGPSGGVNKWSELDDALAWSVSQGMRQYLGIQLINTTQLELPSDLAAEPWDSPRMVQRFQAFLDKLLLTRKGRIRYLSVGNEVDAWMRLHPGDWLRYERFLTQVVAHVHQLDPEIQVGVTVTADGLLGASPVETARLARLGDVWMVTYYPLSLSFDGVRVRDPSVVTADFRRLRELAGAQAILFQEVGYPAAPSLGSSEALQARFVDAVLDAWRADRDRIPFLNFFLLHDFTPQMCADFEVYYAAAGVPGFEDFLCSLGLRRASGEPRLAWTRLIERTSVPGWQP